MGVYECFYECLWVSTNVFESDSDPDFDLDFKIWGDLFDAGPNKNLWVSSIKASNLGVGNGPRSFLAVHPAS